MLGTKVANPEKNRDDQHVGHPEQTEDEPHQAHRNRDRDEERREPGREGVVERLPERDHALVVTLRDEVKAGCNVSERV